MMIVSFIVVALAVGVGALLLMREAYEGSSGRLTAGIGSSVMLSAVYAVAMWAGGLIGSLIRFESPNAEGLYSRPNAYVMMGLILVVVVKRVVPYLGRKERRHVAGIGSAGQMWMLAIASSIDLFLLGMGMGFVVDFGWQVLIVAVVVFLSAAIGVMFGRQRVAMRPRRWVLMEAMLLLAVAIAAVVMA